MLDWNANPFKWRNQKNERARKKLDRRAIGQALDRVKKERQKGEPWEKATRMLGSGVGFFFGGAPGAAAGNLIAGGIHDKFDDTQEQKLTDEGIDDLNLGSASYNFSEIDQNNEEFDRLNKAANMRHITEPIKAYGTAMTMSELGTSGEAWDAMSYGEKMTRSGQDILKDSGGLKNAAGVVADNVFGKFAKDKVVDPEKVSDGVQNNATEVNKALGLSGKYEYGSDGAIGYTGSYTSPLKSGSYDLLGNANKATDGVDTGFSLINKAPDALDPSTFPTYEGVMEDVAGKRMASEAAEKAADRDTRNWLAQSIEGDPDLREELVNKFSTEELQLMRDNNIDWRKWDKYRVNPVTGKSKSSEHYGNRLGEMIEDDWSTVDDLKKGSIWDKPLKWLKDKPVDPVVSKEDLTSRIDMDPISINEFRRPEVFGPYDKINTQELGELIPEVKPTLGNKLMDAKNKAGEKLQEMTDPWKRRVKKDDTSMALLNSSGWNPDNLSKEDYLQRRLSNNPDHGIFTESNKLDDLETYAGGWKDKDKFWDFDPKTGEYTKAQGKESFEEYSPMARLFDNWTEGMRNSESYSYEQIEEIMKKTGLTKEQIDRMIMQGQQF